MEGFCDAVLGDLDVVGVFRGKSAIFEGGGEEVDNSEGQPLFGVGS